MAPKLPTRKLGKNGPEVTALGFGLMGLSALYGKPKPDEDRYALLNHVYNSGEHFWDTSDMYADSEDLIGRWFKLNPGKRENIFLATKFGAYMDPETKQRSVRNDPQYIQTACARSMERLGVDVIDLYYVHRVQESQPIEITMRALKVLQEAGKIRYIGLSEVSAATVRRACSVSLHCQRARDIDLKLSLKCLFHRFRWRRSVLSRSNIAPSPWTSKTRRSVSYKLVGSSASQRLRTHRWAEAS